MAQVNDIDGYPLSRDFIDFNRLNLQHYLWKDVFGYNIHPKILQQGGLSKIADVAAGTGIWLLDVSSQLDPAPELLALDADITQVPPKEWCPPNFSIRSWDMFTEVPDDLIGQFDLVNIRLLVWVISDDPTPVLRNLIKLLKPGGYLQWGEVDIKSMQIETVSPGLPTGSLTALWEEVAASGTRFLPTWVKTLSQLFEREGLHSVEADWQKGKPHTAMAMQWCNLVVHQMVADRVREANTERAAKIDRLVLEAAAETRAGAIFGVRKVTVIGQKPANQ
ncbi:hypothetical protein F4777DRAFT_535249 [Nemania sp. FL0916]|nr:hypothetical protein F4777DRAFT_535249 [Nemania sp. FL0916]